MARTFYTIDDLLEFCKKNQFEKFSSTESGAPLVVQSFGTFESSESSAYGLMNVKLKSCHTGKNRNKSGISDDAMNLYKNTFMGRPILGAIYKTDTGEYEFRAHDMQIVEEDGEMDIQYIEQPIGVISQTKEPYLEYDEDEDKNYLMVDGTIFSEYSKAHEILERRRTCKCSVEIAVEEMSYNVAEEYLSIDKFRFAGVTILGYEQDGVTEIQEGMKGSKITIDSFSKTNSMNYQDKLIETLEKLNETLNTFSNKTNEEGGDKEMDKFNELLAKYGKTVEEITFDYEGLTDEELEVKFKEAFEDQEEEVEVEDPADDGAEDPSASEDGVEEFEAFTKTFSIELSHDDIRYALYNLIEQYDEADNDYYYIRSVYDTYFIMSSWCSNKLYKQSYTVDGETVALDGERQEMFEMILTESEKLAIEKLRENYDALEAKYNELAEFKSQYDAEQVKAQKDAIFAKEEYECLAEFEAFKQLQYDAEKYSVDELSVKADLVFAAYVKSVGEFSSKKDEKKPMSMRFSTTSVDEVNKKPYGSLFED